MSAPGVLVDLEKVEAVMRWERPNINLRDTLFLGIDWILRGIREWAEVVHLRQIIGFHLWNMDSMVGAALTIEREIEDTGNTRDMGVGSKRED